MSLLSRLTASSSLVAWIVVHTLIHTNFPTDRSVVISVIYWSQSAPDCISEDLFSNIFQYFPGGMPLDPVGERLRRHYCFQKPVTNYSRNAPVSVLYIYDDHTYSCCTLRVQYSYCMHFVFPFRFFGFRPFL